MTARARTPFAPARGALAALSCIALVVLASCAAPLVVSKSLDPFAVLAPDELAYLRMDGATARLLAPSLLPAGQGRALAPLLDRTTSLALGLRLPSDHGASFDAVFLGSYPFRSAGIALAGSRGWKREGEGFANESEGIRVSIPGPALVLATSRELEPFLARAKNPGASPLPPRLASLADRELLLWIPKPFSGLAQSLFGSSMDVPALGLALFASRSRGTATGEESYDLSAIFLMKDEEAARVYRPVLRLAWYGLARFLFADEADAVLSARFTLSGDEYASSAVELPAPALAAALSRMGAFQR